MANKQLEGLIYRLEALNDCDFTFAFMWAGRNPNGTVEDILRICEGIKGDKLTTEVNKDDYTRFLMQYDTDYNANTLHPMGYNNHREFENFNGISPQGYFIETDLKITEVSENKERVEVIFLVARSVYTQTIGGMVAKAGDVEGIAITEEQYEKWFS